MRVALQKCNTKDKGVVHWTSCEPFVENTMAVLIHRVRYVSTHKISDRWRAHLAVRCWCGNGMTGTKKFTFLESPPDKAIVCARCDKAAIRAGQPPSEALAGKHVHLGGVVAVRSCCGQEAAGQGGAA
jgi:hypothetical protein